MIEVYDSLLEVPLDLPGVDGDDLLVPGAWGEDHEPDEPLMLTVEMEAAEILVVPYRGPLKLGSTGKPIIALKRALAKSGHLRWQRVFTPVLGVRAVGALKGFQRSAGLKPDGEYGPATHAKLARFYDAYAIRYLLSTPVDTMDVKLRNAFMAEMMYIYNHRWSTRYSQYRPWDGRRPPWALDCSAFGEWCAKYAGMKSLSGYSGWGYGNTDTQISRYRAHGWIRSSIKEAKIGDPKYYGYHGDPSHVAFYIGMQAGIARVASLGSYPLKILGADYRSDGIIVCNLTGR